MTGVLPSTSPLATPPFDGGSSRGSLSRSVSSRGTGSRVPLGTVLISRKSFMQDIQFTAILVEPGDSEIGTVGTGLSGLGVEATGKGIVFCQDSAIGLQVVLRDVRPIHPQTKAFVADELGSTNGFFDGLELFLGAIKLILVDQRALTCTRKALIAHKQ